MLTEIMSGANLSIFAEIGLVMFVIVFIGIVIRTLRQPREEIEALANLPNESDEPSDYKGDTP